MTTARQDPACCFACHALCGVEITRYSWRDRALWFGAAFAVMTCYAAAGFVAIAMRDAPEPVGAPPAGVMVEFAPELAAPELKRRDVAIAQESEERFSSKPTNAQNPVEERLQEVSDQLGESEEVVENPSDLPSEEVEEKVASLVDQPQQVEDKITQESTIPDVVEALNPEVVVPEAAPASTAPESATKLQASIASPSVAPSFTTQPEVQEKISELPAAPAQTEMTEEIAYLPLKWQTRMVAYLNKHKVYPRSARIHRQQGTVQLTFKIDGAGRVLESKIAKSSGYPALDSSVMDLIKKASPVPAPPAHFSDSGITLTVPVKFDLKN